MNSDETQDGVTRDELLERVALMEKMIAEGRRATMRYGWIFVFWGVVNLAGVAWQWLQPASRWVWPVTLGTGAVLQVAALALERGRRSVCGGTCNMQSRSVGAVWAMMGIGMLLYVGSAIARHLTWQIAYMSAVLMLVGLAHATSAMILRWKAQGVIAALWWAGGVALYFVARRYEISIFSAEMFFGMVLFGLYAMWMERRRDTTGPGASHA